jgi:hypothetical protein
MKLNTSAGNTFSEVSKKAKEIANKMGTTVEFEFNGVNCFVDKDTNLDWLHRDYSNSWTMGWKEVGPLCVKKYSPEVQKEFEEKTAIREEQSRLREAEYARKEKAEKEIVEKLVAGINIDIIPEKKSDYDKYVANNSKDGYSRGVIDYGEYWAKLMQVEIAKGKVVREVADECQKNLGFLGITGFMYGCAVQGLSQFWIHGEELRKWHNKKYGVSEDTKGVVNPAIGWKQEI